jgi:peptidoglycan/xylan/chitin deacetylase (PgdA/CDA1 family)
MRAVLTFHSIDGSGSVISIDPVEFRRQLEWLAGSRVKVVSLDRLASETGDSVALTFDDAFANFATEAWPVLESLGLPATVFVPTGHVGGTNAWESGGPLPVLPLMDWATLGRLVDSGLELGSHGVTHADLRRVSDAELVDELEASGTMLRDKTGFRATMLAYPYGAVDDRSADATRSRYAMAFTTEFRDVGGVEDAGRMPRLDACYFRRPGLLEQFGTEWFRRFVARRRGLRRIRRFFERG